MEYKNSGFSEELELEHSSEEDYNFLGSSLPKEVLVDDGDWRPFKINLEIQSNNHGDTYGCTNYANNNQTEFMHKVRYGKEIDYSDSYSAVVSNTRRGVGNSHKNVSDCRRKYGSILEELRPYTKDTTLDQFFSPIPDELKELGLKWVIENEYGYEKVGGEEYEEALRYSPIQVAVDSRTNKTSKYSMCDHSILLICKDKVAKKNYTFDSYLNRFEEYDWDYPFAFGQRAHYKTIKTLILENMRMQLIRDQESGKIYLLDSDGIKHHIEAPTDFYEFMGHKAWEDRDWVDYKPEEIAKYEEGLSISAKKATLADSLFSLFKSFGSKKI